MRAGTGAEGEVTVIWRAAKPHRGCVKADKKLTFAEQKRYKDGCITEFIIRTKTHAL